MTEILGEKSPYKERCKRPWWKILGHGCKFAPEWVRVNDFGEVISQSKRMRCSNCGYTYE